MFRRVLWPLALPGILAGTILTFILAMNAYATPFLLGGPLFKMMAPLVYNQFTQQTNWPFGGAIAFILMTVTLVLTVAANLIFQRRSAALEARADMAEENRLRRFAVLIDADNTSPRIAAGLFEEIAKFGEASVRRIYGDFSSPRMKSWADILQKYAIDPYQQFAYTTGKNASDIALVIDAMDLLHSGRFDGFCLVSSDSDFTRLASRLREQGADVYGFGAQKTPESFRQACRRFIYTENLLPEAEVSTPEEGPAARLASRPARPFPS